MDGSHSGLVRTLGKRVGLDRPREFESHSVRSGRTSRQSATAPDSKPGEVHALGSSTLPPSALDDEPARCGRRLEPVRAVHRWGSGPPSSAQPDQLSWWLRAR